MLACRQKEKTLLTKKGRKNDLFRQKSMFYGQKFSGTLKFSQMSPNSTCMDRTAYGMFEDIKTKNLIQIIYHKLWSSQQAKSMFPIKNDINGINIFYTGSHKSFLIYYGLWRIILKRILTYVIQMYKNIFHIQIHTKDFLYIIGYLWEMTGNVLFAIMFDDMFLLY